MQLTVITGPTAMYTAISRNTPQDTAPATRRTSVAVEGDGASNKTAVGVKANRRGEEGRQETGGLCFCCAQLLLRLRARLVAGAGLSDYSLSSDSSIVTLPLFSTLITL